MDISISEENLARILWKVSQGLYPSADAVLERALDFLDEYDVGVAQVRDMAQAGLDDLRNGRYKTYSKETRDELLDDIKQRSLKLMAERNQSRGL